MTPALNTEKSASETPVSVLLLDDNPADIARITRLLEYDNNIQYDIYPFYDSSHALDFMEERQCVLDICLVDFYLHNETAFDFLKRLSNRTIKHIPIIVMTGQNKPGIDEQLMRNGVHDFWDKRQLNIETLGRCIRFSRYRHNNYLLKNSESERKTRHLAHVNHELKNPLNSIIGFSRILCKIFERQNNIAEKDLLQAHRCFDSINQNCTLLSGLIEDLLDYSAIELGHLSITKSQFNLSCMIKQLVESNRYSADERGLDLSLDISNTDHFMIGDENRLRQALGNFISNAIKYTQKGRVSISVREEIVGQKKMLVIQIHDTGIGIENERLSELFNEFKPLHSQAKTRFESSGLGLVIAKYLIELHHGHVVVTSTLGEGSCFMIHLPLKNH